MKSLLKLQKFINLEHDNGYNDETIIGGLARIIDYWQADARTDNISEEVINNVVSKLRAYRYLSPSYRADSLKMLSAYVRARYPELDQKNKEHESLIQDPIGSGSSITQKNTQKTQFVTPKQIRNLSVFLCHSSNDKPQVRELYKRLKLDQYAPWLDEESLIPGQNWRNEIPKAVRNADVVIVCLSRSSITKAGYVQKEIKYALDAADEQPEGIIFLIPLKLEECLVPEKLSKWHWVNYFEESGYSKLLNALKLRAETI